jgi:hypothetical protein
MSTCGGPPIQGWRNFGAWHQAQPLPMYVTIIVDSNAHLVDSLAEFGLFNIGRFSQLITEEHLFTHHSPNFCLSRACTHCCIDILGDDGFLMPKDKS